MPDETPDRVAATLTSIREQFEPGEHWCPQDPEIACHAHLGARLLAAVEAALKLADRARGVHWGGRYLGWDLDPTDLRAAITAALTGGEAGDGE